MPNPDVYIFLGPPGVGKGTQAKIVADQFNLIHLSTGQLIRDERAKNSVLGKFMDEIGWQDPEKLDELVLQALENFLDGAGERGIILDGCPRSVVQAAGLETLLAQHNRSITKIIEFYGEDEALITRMLGRYSCGECKAIYHDTDKPTLLANKCDICGFTDFFRRPEDSRETVQKRLETYLTKTLPIVKDYATQNRVVQVDGMAPVAQVTQALLKLF